MEFPVMYESDNENETENDTRELPLELVKYIDKDGIGYFQQSKVCRVLGVTDLQRTFPNLYLSRRRATPEELPVLKHVGMHIRSDLVLIRADETEAVLEQAGWMGWLPASKMRKKRNKRKEIRDLGSKSPKRVKSNDIGRPPYTFTQLVGQALLSTQNAGLTRRQVCNWILETYPFYKLRPARCRMNVANALRASKFFIAPSGVDSRWFIVDAFEAVLTSKAYSPQEGRMTARSIGMSVSSPEEIFLDEMDPESVETETVNEGSLTKAEVLPPGTINEAIRTVAEQEHRTMKEEGSSSRAPQERPRVGATPIQVSQPNKARKLPTIVVDDDDDDDEDQYVEITNPVDMKALFTAPPILETIDLTDEENTVVCPLCSASFGTKAALGEHVLLHAEPSTSKIVGSKMGESLESIMSSFGGSGKTPVFIFSGNVYFNSNPPLES